LQKTKQLVEDLQEVPYVKKVNSITNIEFIEGSENGDLKVYGLMDEFPSSQTKANLLKRRLLDKPLYVNGYISDDSNFAAILCEMEDKPKDDLDFHMKIGDGLKSVLSKPDYEDFEFWPVGEPVINSEYNRVHSKISRVALRIYLSYYSSGLCLHNHLSHPCSSRVWMGRCVRCDVCPFLCLHNPIGDSLFGRGEE
jgi:hypothetical protein